jgi:hypothetical protein
VLNSLGSKQDRHSRWARNLVERRGYWHAAIAIAAKNALVLGGVEIWRRLQTVFESGLMKQTE